jgi:hypothetical protein
MTPVSPVREMTLVAKPDPQGTDLAPIFERLATDPNASVEKIERLMALFERTEGKRAESAFNEAMSSAQAAMRPVATDADNPQTRSRYASYAALDRALRPIYTQHGFGLSFDTGMDAPPDHLRVLCYVTHLLGHARTYHVDMPADGKGAKGGDVMTRTHAVGSAASYGMRYLLKMIFNVAVGETDDDGNAASVVTAPRPQAAVKAPGGFDAWVADLEATADQGMPALTAAWNASKVDFRNCLMRTDKSKWSLLKLRALKVRS